jgi:hypothetical protein
VDTGRVKIINRRLYLPTGEFIPNDGRGLGLKAGVDAWLAANPQYCSTSSAPTMQRDPPPHAASYSFEVIPDSAVLKGAYITEADTDSDTGGGDSYCYRRHLHQSRGRLGAWVSRGNRPQKETLGSVSMYPPVLLTHLVAVIACHPPLPSSLFDDVPMTSTYVRVFWTLVSPPDDAL